MIAYILCVSGNFGTVYVGTFEDENQGLLKVAVKTIKGEYE